MRVMKKKVAGYTFFQVVDQYGEVLQVLYSEEEAHAWIDTKNESN